MEWTWKNNGRWDWGSILGRVWHPLYCGCADHEKLSRGKDQHVGCHQCGWRRTRHSALLFDYSVRCVENVSNQHHQHHHHRKFPLKISLSYSCASVWSRTFNREAELATQKPITLYSSRKIWTIKSSCWTKQSNWSRKWNQWHQENSWTCVLVLLSYFLLNIS